MAQGDSAGAAEWAEVDWSRAWLAPYREVGQAATAALAQGASVAEALQSASRLSPEVADAIEAFVPADERPPAEPYETFIARTARVPTRDNLHDLLNGLVWLRVPQLKRCISVLHAEQIALRGVAGRRGAARDALTLLDENGALWAPPAGWADLLQHRQWKALFGAWRVSPGACPPLIVGHALMEKLVRPRKSITAHVWTALPPGANDMARWQPGSLADLLSRPHCPLPVLGVPGWWPPNETDGFYDDVTVFRPCALARP